eukprot:6294311-Amphidinium_carterae.2
MASPRDPARVPTTIDPPPRDPHIYAELSNKPSTNVNSRESSPACRANTYGIWTKAVGSRYI